MEPQGRLKRGRTLGDGANKRSCHAVRIRDLGIEHSCLNALLDAAEWLPRQSVGGLLTPRLAHSSVAGLMWGIPLAEATPVS